MTYNECVKKSEILVCYVIFQSLDHRSDISEVFPLPSNQDILCADLFQNKVPSNKKLDAMLLGMRMTILYERLKNQRREKSSIIEAILVYQIRRLPYRARGWSTDLKIESL
jgi:hypothetical protein